MIFSTSDYARRRRQIFDCVSLDDEGESYGVHMEVSYDSGQTWQAFEGSFDNLAGECGVWISDSQLDNDYFAAAVSGQLRVRGTAAVESDEKLVCTVSDGPVGSTAEVIDMLVKGNETYRYKCVTGRSIFYRDNADIDDGELLMSVVRDAANSDDKSVETIDVHTPLVRVAYQPGDRVISGADGCDILGGIRDGRSVFTIERVAMNYDMQQTRLRIARRRGFKC